MNAINLTTMEKLISCLFLLCSFISVQAQNTSLEADSLENALLKVTDLEEKVDLLNLLAYEKRTYDPRASAKILNEAIELSQKNDYEYGKAYANYVMGTLLMDRGSYDSALTNFKKALVIMSIEGSSKDLENIYNNIGITYKRLGNLDSSNYHYNQAITFITDLYGKGRLFINIGSNYIAQGLLDSAAINQLKAIDIFEQIEEPKALTIAYLNLGNIHYKKEDYGWAMDYYKKSLENAILSNHKPVQSRNYLNIGSIYSLQEKHDTAIVYFRRAVKIQQEMKDQTGLAATYRNLGETLLLMNDLDSAEYYFLLSNNIYKSTNHQEGKVRINKFLSNLYQLKGKFSKAEYHANLAVDLAESSGLTHEWEKSLELQHLIYSQQSKHALAYNALLKQKSLSDSLFKEEKIRQVNELQTQYQTEKKDQEIAILSQQASIQSLEIKQKNQALIIGLVVFLFVLAAIYFVHKQRETKKLQSQTELEQRFLRSQLNPHFISNALVAVQSFMLKNDSESAALYLTKFSKLMREILENSRKEFIPVEEEINMLRNYLDIHKLRLGTFDYSIELSENIDPELDTIPPMFVQPFVENAVEHGIVNQENGRIDLKFMKDGDYISIEVNDNGVGLSSNKNGNHHSLSSTIIQERMELFNKSLKKKIQLVIANLMNERGEVSGTKVELKVPFSYI